MSEQQFPKKTDAPDSPILASKPEDAPEGTLAVCNYQGQQYSEGAVICINHSQFQCGNGGWYSTGRSC